MLLKVSWHQTVTCFLWLFQANRQFWKEWRIVSACKCDTGICAAVQGQDQTDTPHMKHTFNSKTPLWMEHELWIWPQAHRCILIGLFEITGWGINPHRRSVLRLVARCCFTLSDEVFILPTNSSRLKIYFFKEIKLPLFFFHDLLLHSGDFLRTCKAWYWCENK